MKQELFVYGTLHPNRAPAEIENIAKKMVRVGKGTIAGTLHHFEDSPALTPGGKSRKRVHGSIFALPDDPEILRKLDQYEEYQPEDPANSLFIRAKRLVTFENGTRRFCWVYVYNQKLSQAS